jgi:8-oxo-dGTP diphosphatase
MYEFPGGKIEKNETGEEAVKRELKEEMNADIKVENFYYHAHYEYPNFILEMDCYLCSLINENIDLLEHTDYKWIAPNEENINWIPADVQIIEEIRKRGI